MRDGQARRRHLAEPQGDPQPPPGDRARGRRAGLHVQGRQARTRRATRRPRSRAGASTRPTDGRRLRRPVLRARRRDGLGASPRRGRPPRRRAADRRALRRRGRPARRSPTCSRPARAPARSSCSATRTSSRRSRRARTPRSRGARCSSTCSASTRPCRPSAGSSSPQTWRLRPELCAFTSDAYYEGRLGYAPGDALGARSPPGTGPRWLPVEHEGRGQSSVEEADAIAAAIARARRHAVHRRARRDAAAGRAGRPRRRARTTPRCGCCARAFPTDVAVGTVDKFQGQQAPVVFVSMASSTPEDAPRGHRLRVRRAPVQRRDVARAVPRRARLRAAAPRRRLQDRRADAARQRRLPVRRARRDRVRAGPGAGNLPA